MPAFAPARHRVRGLIVVVIAAALVAVGCQADGPTGIGDGRPRDGSNAVPKAGGHLVVAIPGETIGWNPFIGAWGDAGSLVGTSILEPLAIQDDDGRPQPWLAESWQPNADFTTWDIALRPGVVFQDDTPMDAAAVKKSIDASLQTGLFRMSVSSLYDRVEVVGPLKVRVHLKTKWAQYPIQLVDQWVLAPAMLSQPDAGAGHPIGTGPFAFQDWSPGRSVTTTRFARYWRKDAAGRPLPHLDGIEFRTVVDDIEREHGLEDGSIDLAFSPTGDFGLGLTREVTAIKDYTGERTLVMLNTATGKDNEGNPFVNVHARRAVAYATNRQEIADHVGRGIQTTPYGFRPDSPWAPTGDDGYASYDPGKARAEVEAYKQETRSSGLRVTFSALAAPIVQQTAKLLKEQWARAGITMKIETIPDERLAVAASFGQYQALWVRFFSAPDPDQMYSFLSSSTVQAVGTYGLNITRYSSPRLDANLKVIRESADLRERKVASDAVVRETNEQVTNLWLYDTPESIVATTNVKGLEGFRTHSFANALPKPWLAEAWLDR